jgi:hypothetical protein
LIKAIVLYFLFTCFLYAGSPKYPIGITESDYSQFWFLYQSEKREGQTEFILRPFYSNYIETLSNHRFKTSLYPVYYKQETSYWYKWSFLFIFDGNYTKHPDTGDDKDLTFGPFFRFGSGDTEKDRYFAFFPFYGKMKSLLSWSELNFVLFPLYVDWSHKDFKARSILWPLTVYGKNHVRKEIRVFPFYSHKSHIGKYYRYSILWPLFQWGKQFLDKKEPIEYGLYFPFYSYKKSMYGNMVERSYLYILIFPLYSYGYDKRTSLYDYRFLSFLFQYGYSNDKDYRKFIFFPFYGTSKYASKESLFITPFYFSMKSDTYLMRSEYTYLVPFYFRSEKQMIKEERNESYLKIWPLFRYYKDSEGNLSWNTFSLMPAKSVMIDRIWDPLISVVEYSQFINGEKRFSVLMRLYTQRWTDDQFHLYIPILLDYHSEKDKLEWNFLYGLVGYTQEPERQNYKFLWVFHL